jgi:hypothetical protein
MSSIRKTSSRVCRSTTSQSGHVPDCEAGPIGRPYSADPLVNRRNKFGRKPCTYISTLSRRQAANLDQCKEVPRSESAKACGSTSSTKVECLQLPCSVSSGSVLQSVRKMEPRQSVTRNSLLLVGCELTVVKGCGKVITYAVGWGRGLGGEEPLFVDISGEGIPEEISKVG